MTTDSNWPGSRWWRFDLHAHTPKSLDFRGGAAADPAAWDAWVNAARDASLDAVAVTDHNTAAGVGPIQEASRRRGSKLVVFPGVELTAADGSHLLFVLGPETGQSHVEEIISRAGITVDRRGQNDARSNLSVENLLDLRTGFTFLVLGAHVNGAKGLLEHDGQQRIHELKSHRLAGVEIEPDLRFDPTWLDGCAEVGRSIPKLWASDAHEPSELGRRFTWIKMTRPDLDGLRLALLDGEDSLRPRRIGDTDDPNRHAPRAIESITVGKAKYMGRRDPFTVGLNPWMNAIIGGRGTGKSTLVDLARFALRREGELTGDLRAAVDRRVSVPASRRDEGLLTPETTVDVVYHKDGQRFVIGWDKYGTRQPIVRLDGDQQTPEEGDVRERFPVRIFSQKQLFELARDPNSLLEIIDAGSRGRSSELLRARQEAESEYLSLRAEGRALRSQAASLSTRRVELDDVRRKVELLQQGGHAEILKQYRVRRRQDASWARSLDVIKGTLNALRAAIEDVTPPDLDSAATGADDPALEDLAAAHARGRSILDDLRGTVMAAIAEAELKLGELTAGESLARWRQAVGESEGRYQQVGRELSGAGIATPDEYGELLQRAATLEQEIRALEDRQTDAIERERDADRSLQRYRELTEELTTSRRSFANQASGDLITVEVLARAQRESFADWLRETLGVARFDPDHDRVVGDVVGSSTAPGLWSYERLDTLVGDLRAFLAGARESLPVLDQRFAAALKRVPPERVDRLALYAPDDAVEVTFRDPRDGASQWRSLSQGSPGQQTAALLAFVLGYGDEPIILDQPEDDLDNTIIYELLVRKLRESKPRRQIVVVTHNSNIVVHGDAELVVSLTATRGQTQARVCGGLQEQAVRDEICRVMEGGREAFDSRYHRIMPASGGRDG